VGDEQRHELAVVDEHTVAGRDRGELGGERDAQQLAVGRLSALAFDRAIHGRIEQVFDQGQLVAERRVPSERLLIWLLARLDPKRFAAPWERRKDDISDPQAEAQQAFPALLGSLTDVACD